MTPLNPPGYRPGIPQRNPSNDAEKNDNICAVIEHEQNNAPFFTSHVVLEEYVFDCEF